MEKKAKQTNQNRDKGNSFYTVEAWLTRAKKSKPEKVKLWLDSVGGQKEALLALTEIFPQIQQAMFGKIPDKGVIKQTTTWYLMQIEMGLTLPEIKRWVDTLDEEIFWAHPEMAQHMYVWLARERYEKLKEKGISAKFLGWVLTAFESFKINNELQPAGDEFSLMDTLLLLLEEELIDNPHDLEMVAKLHQQYKINLNHTAPAQVEMPATPLRLLLLNWWRVLKTTTVEEQEALAADYLYWLGHSFSAQETVLWRHSGFCNRGAWIHVEVWRKLGFTPEEAKEWLGAGWPAEEPRGAAALAKRYRESGLNAKEILASEKLLNNFAGEEITI